MKAGCNSCADVAGGQQRSERHLLAPAHRSAAGRYPFAPWPAYDLRQPLQPVGKAGRWARILQAVSAAYDRDIQMIDVSAIRVHQHAANSKKDERPRCTGCSRGGLTTKIHALVDAEGRPIQLKLTEGQAYDRRSATDALDVVEPGNILLADRAYDNDALREEMSRRSAWANVRAMPNRVKTFAFSRWLYRQRNAVERFFNKLKLFRAVATRYDKRNHNFLASVQLASIRIWLRSYKSVT